MTTSGNMSIQPGAQSGRPQQSERASGPQIGVGRRRTIDIDDDDDYQPVLFRVSQSFYRRLRMAVVLSESESQLEFIIRTLEPAIEEVLEQHGIDHL